MATDDREARILSLAPVVEYQVSRRPRSDEDTVQDAWLGAIRAVDNYDDSREASLATYAQHRISGAITDGLRERDVVSRRSNWDQDDPRIARALSFDVWSESNERGDPGSNPADIVVEQMHHDWLLQQAELAALSLPGRDRAIVRDYYSGRLIMKQIAKTYGLTESRVCQIINHHRRLVCDRVAA